MHWQTKAYPSGLVSQLLKQIPAHRDAVQPPSLQSCVHGPETALSGFPAHAWRQERLMSIVFLPPFSSQRGSFSLLLLPEEKSSDSEK